jgi:hypothetical protein
MGTAPCHGPTPVTPVKRKPERGTFKQTSRFFQSKQPEIKSYMFFELNVFDQKKTGCLSHASFLTKKKTFFISFVLKKRERIFFFLQERKRTIVLFNCTQVFVFYFLLFC